MEENTLDTTQPQQATEQTTAQQPQVPDLNVSDLMALKSIVDVASQRGAFKAAELESVGRTYNKLSMFLDHISTKKE